MTVHRPMSLSMYFMHTWIFSVRFSSNPIGNNLFEFSFLRKCLKTEIGYKYRVTKYPPELLKLIRFGCCTFTYIYIKAV